MNSRLIYLLALIPLVAAGAPEPAKPPARPNLVFILADDLGWRDLGCYGSTFYETPHLDRLAATGMRFTDAYAACSVCSPTRASILTGKYPARLHLTDWLPGRSDRPDQKLKRPVILDHLPLGEVTLAEALREGATGPGSSANGTWGAQTTSPTSRDSTSTSAAALAVPRLPISALTGFRR